MIGYRFLYPALTGITLDSLIVFPVPKLSKKYLPSIPALIADFLNSSTTILEGLFCPTPPSMREYYLTNETFLISAAGKNIGAADVALPTSLM